MYHSATLIHESHPSNKPRISKPQSADLRAQVNNNIWAQLGLYFNCRLTVSFLTSTSANQGVNENRVAVVTLEQDIWRERRSILHYNRHYMVEEVTNANKSESPEYHLQPLSWFQMDFTLEWNAATSNQLMRTEDNRKSHRGRCFTPGKERRASDKIDDWGKELPKTNT